MSFRPLFVVLLAGALTGCIDDDCWGCDEILIVEHHFEPVGRSVDVEACDGDYCASAIVGRGRCVEPDWPDERGFFLCYGDGPRAGVSATRRFRVRSEDGRLPPDNDVSLRIVADDVTILDASGRPSVERYEACSSRCSTRELTL